MADPETGAGGLSAAEQAGERAAKNTVVRAGGEIVGKLASLVLFAVLAREVGAAALGVFVFALAWGEVAMTPVGLGIDRYLLRRVAKDRSALDGVYLNALALKVARGVPIVLLSIAAVHLLDFSGDTPATVSVIVVGVFLDTLARTPMSVFNAFERGELVASTIVAQRMLAAALGLAALAAGYGVVAVAVAFAIGAAVRLLLSVWLLARRIRPPRWTFPAEARRDLRSRSLPFTAQDIFGLVLARVDVLLLSALASDAVVGLYGAAYRLLDSTAFIAVALSGAFSAMYTYLGPDTTPTIRAVFQRSLKLALIALVPIAVTFGVLAEPVSRAFFGAELEQAADPLRLLAPVVVLFGVIVLSGSLVVSRTKPTRMLAIVAVAGVVNLALNLALIPSLDEVGAALAMLLAETLYVALALRLAVQLVGGIDWRSVLAAPIAAGLAMAGPMVLLGDSLAPAAAAGAVVYLAVAVAVERATGGGDLRFALDLVRRRLPGGRGAGPQPGSA